MTFSTHMCQILADIMAQLLELMAFVLSGAAAYIMPIVIYEWLSIVKTYIVAGCFRCNGSKLCTKLNFSLY